MRPWLDDVKDRIGLSSNEMWRKLEDCVAWRKHIDSECYFNIQEGRVK